QKEAARRHWYAEAWCSTTGERYDVMGVDRHALIDDLLSHYSRWVAARTAPQPVLEPPPAEVLALAFRSASRRITPASALHEQVARTPWAWGSDSPQA
ncbi:MAG: hypothetical protein VXX81_02555, partial [Pseudomonadota bacterium]|nr:hypothetical protein [Pseudomonadota bacterium]